MGKKSAAQKRAERDPEWATVHFEATMATRGNEGPHGRDRDLDSSFSARRSWTQQMQRATERAQARLEREQGSTASASTGPAVNVAASRETWTQGALTVEVYTHGGHLCDVPLQHPEAIVGELQWAIHETCGIPLIEQRLFVGEAELTAGERLSYHAGLSLSPSRRLRVLLIRRAPLQARWLMRVLHGSFQLRELEDAPSEIRGDKDVVLAAVQSDGHALRWSSQELRRDKEVVLEALRTTPFALQHAAPELQSDKEVVMTAVSACGRCMQWASVELRADREVALAAARSPGQNTFKWCE